MVRGLREAVAERERERDISRQRENKKGAERKSMTERDIEKGAS